MATDAQIRCSPASCSGRQLTNHPSRVTHLTQKSYNWRRQSSLVKQCSLSAVSNSLERICTRQTLCKAREHALSDSPDTSSSQQSEEADDRAQSGQPGTAQAAAIVGVVAVVSVMLAVPASADASEALPLDFLTKFLVRIRHAHPK